MRVPTRFDAERCTYPTGTEGKGKSPSHGLALPQGEVHPPYHSTAVLFYGDRCCQMQAARAQQHGVIDCASPQGLSS